MKSLKENLKEIKSMDLRNIIEKTGGVFVNANQFTHEAVFGHEKTPSNFIYIADNGEQKWRRFKENGVEIKGGDAVDYVRMALGVDYKEAIEYILGNKTEIAEKSVERNKSIQTKEKADKDRKTMFAIISKSKYVLDSDLGITYLKKRGILNAYKSLKDPKFVILANEYTLKNGEKINKICYLFEKDEKNNKHTFMITKGIDERGNKNGNKYNYIESRPVMHYQSTGKPVIICEGMEDAISSIELGYENFISLNSTSNVNKILNGLQKHPDFYRINSVELCLDNDESGIKATNKIKAACFIQDLYTKGQMSHFLKKLSQVTDKNMDSAINIIRKYSRIEEMQNWELVKVAETLANNSSLLTGFGDYFKVRESEWFTILKELRCNDLNDLLVKVIKETEKVEKTFGNNNKRKEMER